MDKIRRLNRQEALTGDEFHYGECTRTHGPRGGVQEDIVSYRRTGQTKFWKTRPEDFRVPVRYGMRNSGHACITPDNVEEFHLAKHCPLNTVEHRRVLGDGRIVEVVKWGGGTLGRRYDGDWQVGMWSKQGALLMDDTLRTGTPKTHQEVSEMTVEFLDGS